MLFLALGLYLIVSILEDYGYIENNSKLWHWADATGLTIFVTYACYMRYGLTFKAAIIAVDALVFWWVWFDIGLNLKRKLPVFYVGSGTMDLTVKWIAKKLKVEADKLMFFIKLFVVITMMLITIYYL